MSSIPPIPTISKADGSQKKKRTKRVKRACFHCKKSKTSCSDVRPCTRCVKMGLSDTCMDTPRSNIQDEERKLWSQTLEYLSSTTTPSNGSDEQQLREMIQHYARRVSNGVTDTASPALLLGAPTTKEMSTEIEKSYQSKIEYLEGQNSNLLFQVQNLLQQLNVRRETERAMYNFSSLSTWGELSVSRWIWPSFMLKEYNPGFVQLIGRKRKDLEVYNCRQMHDSKYLTTCSSVVYLISNSLVTSIELNQEWLVAGESVPVKTFLHVILNEVGLPKELLLYSKRSLFSFSAESLFRPVDITLSETAKAQNWDVSAFLKIFGDHGSYPAQQKSMHGPHVCAAGLFPVAKIMQSSGPCSSPDSLSPSSSPPSLSPGSETSSPIDFDTFTLPDSALEELQSFPPNPFLSSPSPFSTSPPSSSSYPSPLETLFDRLPDPPQMEEILFDLLEPSVSPTR